jgi:hypothetical protein
LRREDFCSWPETEVPRCLRFGRDRVESGGQRISVYIDPQRNSLSVIEFVEERQSEPTPRVILFLGAD